MRPRFSLLPLAVVLSLVLTLYSASPLHAARMRPYAGIGVMLLPLSPSLVQEAYGELTLYDQPALGRLGTLSSATLPRLDWILGLAPRNVPVMVMARRGEWLRVTYDDAGREGWVRPRWRNPFETWDEVFAGRNVRPLPGLQDRYYRLYSRPEGEPLADLTSRPLFRVGMVAGDWLRVVGARDAAGWVRWRDEDGRMLIALEPEQSVSGER